MTSAKVVGGIEAAVIVGVAIALIGLFVAAFFKEKMLVGALAGVVLLLYAIQNIILLSNIKDNLNPTVYQIYIVSASIGAAVGGILTIVFGYISWKNMSSSSSSSYSSEPATSYVPPSQPAEASYNATYATPVAVQPPYESPKASESYESPKASESYESPKASESYDSYKSPSETPNYGGRRRGHTRGRGRGHKKGV